MSSQPFLFSSASCLLSFFSGMVNVTRPVRHVYNPPMEALPAGLRAKAKPSRNIMALSLDVEENQLRQSLARLDSRLMGLTSPAPPSFAQQVPTRLDPTQLDSLRATLPRCRLKLICMLFTTPLFLVVEVVVVVRACVCT